MNKKRRIFSIFLVLIMVFTLIPPTNVEAASKVAINKTKTTIYIGSTETLKITGTSKTVSWNSSDKKVAIVNSNGKVTPKKEGTTTITAKVSGKNYKCTVTVKKPSINATKKTLYVGNSYTLKLTGTSIKSVKTSDKSIATVSSKGKVVAKKAGTATITLTGKDGKKYTCKVTVKKPTLNATQKTLEVGKTYTLKLTGATVKSFKSSKTNIATVNSSGKITAKKAGTATITVTDTNGKTYKCTVTVKTHSHTWDSGKVTTKATCGKAGVKTYTCTSCSKTKTEKSAATGKHSYNSGEITVDATCNETGVKTYTCTRCNKTKTETVEATGKHSWNSGEITTQPTCNKEGVKTYTCTHCQATKTEKVAKITTHKWDAGKVTTEPNCTNTGVKTYTCSDCKTTKTENIKAEGHSLSNIEVVGKESTCTAEGYYERHCTKCDVVLETRTMEKKSHSPSDWITDEEATCTTEGTKHTECTVCRTSLETGTIEKISHSYTWNTTKEPSVTAATCEDDFGVRVGRCSCGATIEENIIRIDIGNGETALVYGYYDDAMAMECLELINNVRKDVKGEELVGDEWIEIDTPPLEIMEQEMIGAKIRAAEIAYYYSHTRPNSEKIWGEYYDGGENIAHGPRTAFEVFDGWMRSEGHAGNIIDGNFIYTGIAVFWEHSINPDNGSIYYYPSWVNGFSYEYKYNDDIFTN